MVTFLLLLYILDLKRLNIIITVLFLSTSLLINAQNKEKREIGSFDKLDVFGNIQVEMKQGEKESLEISTINADPSDVVIKVDDRLLKIRMKSNLFDEDVKVKVALIYTDIREISINAAAQVIVKDVIKGDKLFIDATSGARIVLNVELNAVDLKAYQGAHIDISGKTILQEAFVNTGGILAGSNFNSDDVFIKMNTGGKAEIVVNKILEANVNTGASLNYFGKPSKENISTSLGGKIIAWDKEEEEKDD